MMTSFFKAIFISFIMVHMTNAAGSGPCNQPCYVDCDPDWICTNDTPTLQNAAPTVISQASAAAVPSSSEPTCDELGGVCLKACGGNPCNAAGGGGNQCPNTEVCCKGDGCKFRRMLRA